MGPAGSVTRPRHHARRSAHLARAHERSRTRTTQAEQPSQAPSLQEPCVERQHDNAFENIWEYMRPNRFRDQGWRGYKAIVDACCNAWNNLMDMPEQIASLTQRSWAAITVSG